MIRLARQEDIPRILELMKDFHDASPFKNYNFSWVKSEALCKAAMQTGIVAVMLKDNIIKGFIGGLVSELPTADARFASELGWWVDPDARGYESFKLLEVYEYWAKHVVKTDAIQVSNLMNEYAEGLNKFYTKRGYEKKEETWLFQL